MADHLSIWSVQRHQLVDGRLVPIGEPVWHWQCDRPHVPSRRHAGQSLTVTQLVGDLDAHGEANHG